MFKSKYFINRMLIVICILLTYLSCQTKKKYTIGILTNLEGANSEMTITAFNSIKMAYNDLKKNNNINVVFKGVDESFDPKKIRESYKLLKTNNYDIIIAMTTSTSFLSVYKDVLKNNSILHLIVGPTTAEISNKDDNVIRNGLDIPQYQSHTATFLNSRSKKLLVIQESEKNKSFTFPSFKYFKKKYKGNLEYSLFSALSLNFDDPLNKFKNSNFDYVYIIAGSTPRSVGILIQKIHMINPNTKILVMSWVWGEVLKETMGKYRKNVIVSYPFDISDKNNYYHNYKKKLKTEFNAIPNNYSNLAYDAANILFKALIKKNTSKIDILKKEILSVTYSGNSKIVFNKYGDTVGPLYFYSINDEGELKNME